MIPASSTAPATGEATILKTILQAVMDGLIVFDSAGTVRDFNHAAVKIFGYRPDEIVGGNITMLIRESCHQAYDSRRRAALSSSDETSPVTSQEMLARRKDGSIFSMDMSLRTMSIDGECLLIAGVRDMTETKVLQADLAGQMVAIGKSQAVLELSMDGIILNANDNFLRIVGYTLPEIEYKHHSLFLDAASRNSPAYEEFWRKLRNGDFVAAEFKRIGKNGKEVWIQGAYNPICDMYGKPYKIVKYATDITERIRQDALREELMDKLLASNTELERFAYIASHDMQEPIRIINNFGTIVAEDYGRFLDDAGREYLQLVVDSGARMRNLIDDLLSYARIDNEDERLAAFDGNAMLESALENLRQLIDEHKARITSDTLPRLYGNPMQFMRLLQNLVANAIKYQPAGNIPRIHIGVEESASEWCVTVRDNGIGIDEKFIAEIFQPFRRLHTWEQIRGTGLGLSICKKIVENHGGAIRVSSTPGQGSVFSFTLAKENRPVSRAA